MARVNRDSSLWENTFKSYKEKKANVYQVKQPVQIQKPTKFIFTKTDKDLKSKLTELNSQIALLKSEQQLVVKEIRKRRTLRNKGIERKVSLYALKLQNDRWYIGMSYNVNKRFTKHQRGKGAIWTKKYAPIEIHEVRPTDCYHQDEVARMEDDMTIEYALLYGSDKVRGGGYCQAKPRWPDTVIQNEINL